MSTPNPNPDPAPESAPGSRWKHVGGAFAPETEYAHLKACGPLTKIYAGAALRGGDRISIGNACSIDDFTFIYGGQGVEIGNRVHVASFTSIIGGGRATIEDFAGVAAGCRIITGSDECMGAGLTNPCVPAEFRRAMLSSVVLRKHSLLFTNVIVLPGVEVGEGVVVSAGAVVRKSLAPWGIYRMRADKLVKVAERPRETMLRMEEECRAKYGF